VAAAVAGYDGRGKRIMKKATAKTKTEAQKKLKAILKEIEAGRALAPGRTTTVAAVVEDWLAYGLGDVSDATRANYESFCHSHVIPLLGAYKVKDLRTSHVDHWLEDLSPRLSKRSLKLVASLLSRSIRRAMAQDLVARNVVEVATIPAGRKGRPSKALTIAQAQAILDSAARHPFYAYITVSLLTGARTEEVRALTWDRTHLTTGPNGEPPHIKVWRSERTGGDTKTKRSRRSLALPERAVTALLRHRYSRLAEVGVDGWRREGLVFCSVDGTAMTATSARWYFRRALDDVPGINPDDWSPRELRHSFVSILSARNVPIEEISKLVGHSSITVTETIYRKQIAPKVEDGTQAMDNIFRSDDEQA
jgi:integrase